MKHINKILATVTVASLVLASGCTNTNRPNEGQNIQGANTERSGQDIPARYSAQGKIVKIDKDGLHVQDGENVNLYKVDQARSSNYFLGEYVGLNKLEGDSYDAVSDQYFDYSLRRTSDGNEIKRITATVGDVNDEFISAVTEMGDIKFKNPGNFSLMAGDQFMADYIEGDNLSQMLSFYDESSKISATVREISRDVSGMLRIYAVSNDKEYDIRADADTITNFAHSTLRSGDEIIVYPEDTWIGDPEGIDAKLIVKR